MSLALVIVSPSLCQSEPIGIACIKRRTGKISIKTSCSRPQEKRFSRASYAAANFVVAARGAEYLTIQAAITAAQAAGVSATNPAIIKVAPGVYNLSSGITLIPGLTIVGSGIDRTIINHNVSGYMITMSDNSALENLSLRKTTADTNGTILVEASTGVVLDHCNITIDSSQASKAITLIDSTVEIKDLKIDHSGTASNVTSLISSDSSFTAHHLRIVTSGVDTTRALLVEGSGSVEIYDSYIEGEDTDFGATAVQTADTATFLIKNSRLIARSAGSFGPVAFYFSGTNQVKIFETYAECWGSDNSDACMLSVASGQVEIVNSRVDAPGTLNTIASYNGSTVKVANSTLSGDTVVTAFGGTITCGGITDENFTFSTSTCP